MCSQEQQPCLPPVPLSERLDASEPTLMEVDELSDSEGLYGDAAGSTGGTDSHAAAALHSEATAKGACSTSHAQGLQCSHIETHAGSVVVQMQAQ